MTAREIALLALAGPYVPDHASDVLGISFEYLHAEASSLVDSLDQKSDLYSLAMAHAARLKALETVIDEYMTVAYRAEQSESEAAQ